MKRGSPWTSQLAIGDAVELAIATAEGGAEEPPKVVQLFRMGAHPSRNGKPRIVRVDNLAHAERIAAAASAYHRSNDMVFDYDHQTVFAAKDGVGGQARAAGWSPRVFATEEGIFAEVAWNAAAASAIMAKEYRYLSPVFTHDAEGRVICPINVALTNTPSLDLPAVATAFASSLTGEASMDLTAIAKALGLGEDASLEEILRAIANLNSAPAAMTALATALGVAEGSDLVAAASALKIKADNPDPAAFVPVGVVSELKASVQSLQGTIDTMAAKDRKAKIDAVSDRLPPAMLAYATSITDDAQLDKFLAGLPENGLGKPAVEGDPEGGKGKLNAAELAVASAFGMTEDEFIAERGVFEGGTN